MTQKASQFSEFIVITSDEPWSEIWHTQLHYAYQLSKRTEVVFLGPPKPWRFGNLFRFSQQTQRINEHLTVVDYLNFFPAALGKPALYLNDKLNSFLLSKDILKKKSASNGIIWHFDPHRSFYIFRGDGACKHLFHVIDPIAGCNLDMKLATTSDMIVVTSPRFTDHYKAINKNVIQIGQGVDVDFYKEDDSERDLSTLPSFDSILLLGTISDQLHFGFLTDIANKFKGKLVLIGPDKTISEKGKSQFKGLLQTEGVTWLGAMPPLDFRKHLRACRTGIIAYDNSVNYKNDFRSPLKVISYLGCGKCVISNIDCEVSELVGNAIYNVTTIDEYFQLIDQSYQNTLLFDQQKVDLFLDSIDYDNLLGRIFKHLNMPLPEKR